MKLKQVLGCVALLSVFCVAVYGQAVSTDQVSGVVQDQTGAIIVGAQVQMKSTNTGLVRNAVTDSRGYYTIQELPVGPYSLQVSKQGFNTYVQNGIVLQVAVNPTVNATLQVGAQTQQVVVEANASMVETENTGVGQVINQEQVEDLPLNGREVAQLITLSGGSAPSGGSVGDLNSNKNYGAGTVANAVVTDAVAGGQGNTVSFVMDGGINNDPRNNLNAALPFPDAIQEFNVQTSSLSSRYGQNSTAAVNIVTKNGTNQFHGDAFEYVRNYLFNARAANAPTRDSLKRNQFGGVIGGPIKKDKLFFFVGYQGTILKSNPTSNSADVPTQAELNGDFSAVLSNLSTCNLPTTTALNSDFTNGVWNNSAGPWQINPLAQTILKYLPPAPTTGNTTQTVCGQVTVPISANMTDKETIGRIDWNANSKHTVFVRYFLAINSQPVSWDQKDFLELNKMGTYERDQETTIGDTYTITGNLINNIRLTGNRDLNLRTATPVPFGGPQHDPSGLTGTGGVCATSESNFDCSIQMHSLVTNYFPISVSAGGFGGFLGGGTNPGYFNSTLFQLADDVDWNHGNHEVSFGFDYIHQVANTVNTRPDNGSLSFTGTGSEAAGKTGLGYADFFLGLLTPASFTQGNSLLDNDWSPYYGAYISDNWKVRHNLSIELGIRYEPYIQAQNINDHVSNFQMAAFVAQQHTTVYTNAPDGLFFTGDPGYPGKSNSESHYDRWAPRVGIVWDPTGNGKTSIRAGFGIFNNAAELFNYNHEASNPPWGDILDADTNPSDVVPFSTPWANYPGGDPFPGITVLSKNSAFPANATYTNQPINMPAPYSMQWNLSIQHQFGSWLLSANYMGNGSRHLQSGYNADPTIFVPGLAGPNNATASSTISGLTGTNCTIGASSTTQGVFLTGPFAGQADGLTSTYPIGDPCSAAGSAMTSQASSPFARSSVTNYRQRQYMFENGVNNPSNQANDFGTSLPQMDPGATSNYNALLLSVNHRLSNNFSLLANYTYSHCLQVPVQDEWQGGSYYPQTQPLAPGVPDFTYRAIEYHNCDSDERHVVNVSLIAETPKFTNGILNAIMGGWQASVIGGFHTGTYSQVTTGFDTSFTNQSGFAYAMQVDKNQLASDRYQIAPGNNCTLGPEGTCNLRRYYLNPAAYQPQALGAFGTSWAQDVPSPSYFDVDTGLMRTFKIRENKTVMIRWEIFNFDNHVNWTGPTTSMTSSTFGELSGVVANNYRVMQFATKFTF
ncbi:MAG TPA: carboxypeptidase regulatory-like domain-containing protein [Candidatus Aquilonibacter sp.]|nr:carboxypeptidase regulatory-like domain-containing protein [Candidatus Aquilonibacter sp.]